CFVLFYFFFFLYYVSFCFFLFFFQAEDGIRDTSVTGVQTCALPICAALEVGVVLLVHLFAKDEGDHVGILLNGARFAQVGKLWPMVAAPALGSAAQVRQRDHRPGAP